MAFAVLDRLVKDKDIQLDYTTAEKNYIKSICKGLFKIMSKMGISTIRSYRGAKIFEAVGLSEELSKAYLWWNRVTDRRYPSGRNSQRCHCFP